MNNKLDRAVEQCWSHLGLWRFSWWLRIHGKTMFRLGYLLGRCDALQETRPDWQIHVAEWKELELEYQNWCLRK